MRRLSQLVFLLVLLLICNACMFAQFKVHVKPQPLAFTNATGDLSIVAGSGFVVGLNFTGGVPPYVCTLNGAPTYVYLDAASGGQNGWCAVKSDGTPSQPPSADVVFTVVVTDSKAATSTQTFTLTQTPAPLQIISNAVFTTKDRDSMAVAKTEIVCEPKEIRGFKYTICQGR